MYIVELQHPEEFAQLYPLVAQLNPHMTREGFDALLAAMLPLGYRCIAMLEEGKYIGIAGFWVGTKFWCGQYIDVDNFVVDAAHRGQGIGSQLLRWIEEEGQRLGCQLIDFPVYTHNHDAHKFYFREGYKIEGFYFTKRYV